MKKEELKAKILTIIVDTINNSHEDKITAEDVENAETLKDVNLDSLTAFELLCYFEDAFGIEIPTEDAEKVMSLNAAVDYIQEKLTPQ